MSRYLWTARLLAAAVVLTITTISDTPAADPSPAKPAATPAATGGDVAGDAAAAQFQAAQEARRRRLDGLRAAITGGDRANRVATYQTAITGDDVALRRLAVEAALDSRDPALGNLVLRDWLTGRQAIPVLLYATKEDPGSVTVLQNLGPLTFKPESFNPATGEVVGNLGAPGYDVTRPSTAVGALAQTTLTLNAYGCQLALQLTEYRTLDGLYRCKTLPALVARVVLD